MQKAMIFDIERNSYVNGPGIRIICGVNDTVEEMQRIKAFLDGAGKPEKIELLPYHAMGENKYRALGEKPQVFEVPTPEQMKELKAVFGI